MGRAPTAGLFLAVFTASALAWGDPVDGRSVRPSPEATAGLATEPAPANGSNVALTESVAFHPITARADSGLVLARPITSFSVTDLAANLGIGRYASIGILLPSLVVDQNSGFGDPSVRLKGTILPNADGGFGVAAIAEGVLPVGRAEFASEKDLRFGARAIADYNFVLADVQAQLGFRLRSETRAFPYTGFVYGDEIPFALGFRLNPALFRIDESKRQTWELGLHGTLPAGPNVLPFGGGDPGSAALTDARLAASDRVELGHDRDLYLLVGVDVGIVRGQTTPPVLGLVSLGWQIRSHDRDHDGVPDDVDKCPDIPEDPDGHDDRDGCPEIDDDGDGIVDAEDDCPRAAGPKQAHPKNGCPAKDTDGDGIPDDVDACPTQKGPLDDDPKTNGCPL